LNKHLRDTGESYWRHAYFAIRWGIYLIATGLVSILHGLFPSLWPFKAPNRVMTVAKVVKAKHPEIFQRYISEASDCHQQAETGLGDKNRPGE
jgi:uncharacterized protein YjeT (DUF2065 family)